MLESDTWKRGGERKEVERESMKRGKNFLSLRISSSNVTNSN